MIFHPPYITTFFYKSSTKAVILLNVESCNRVSLKSKSTRSLRTSGSNIIHSRAVITIAWRYSYKISKQHYNLSTKKKKKTNTFQIPRVFNNPAKMQLPVLRSSSRRYCQVPRTGVGTKSFREWKYTRQWSFCIVFAQNIRGWRRSDT